MIPKEWLKKIRQIELRTVRLAAAMWLGGDPLPAVPMRDRDIFDLLGYD